MTIFNYSAGGNVMSIDGIFTARTKKLGTIITLGWFFILGPIGALLIGGIAYSIVVESLLLGVICGFLVFAPTILTIMGGLDSLLNRQKKHELSVEKRVEEYRSLVQILRQRNIYFPTLSSSSISQHIHL